MTLDPQTPIISDIDPEIVTRLTPSRRAFLKFPASTLGVMASAPLILAAASREAFGQDLPMEIIDVLNFALTLEHLEDTFYRTAFDNAGLIPKEHEATFQQIGLHEAQHVAFLETALGSAAVKRGEYDFTAAGKYADVFSNFATFATLSKTFEDLGVAAYKGQAGNLIGNDAILTAALQIHSVEARHAARVRQILDMKPWDAAFDEPMTKEMVLEAATPFLAAA
jgi:hypothetical protein